MKTLKFSTILAFLALSILPSWAAGLQLVDVPQDNHRPAITGAVWYPCARTPTDIKIASFDMTALQDCPIIGTKHPLVIISHGAGGTFGNYHVLAELLAE